MGGIGHNGGPTMEPGTSWRRHCWTKARRDLLPAMPLEVIGYRMKRATELGLDYRTYAGVRATTGRDIVAFLFSSNALRLHRTTVLPDAEAEKLARIIEAARLAAVYRPLDAGAVLQGNPAALDHAAPRPRSSTAGVRRAARSSPSPARRGCRPTRSSWWARPPSNATGAAPRGSPASCRPGVSSRRDNPTQPPLPSCGVTSLR
jgi:hypothetical protein